VNVPGDYDLLAPWFNVIRRARQKAVEVGGVTAVRMMVIVNENGQPIEPWTEPRVVKLEPRMGAANAVETLLNLFVD